MTALCKKWVTSRDEILASRDNCDTSRDNCDTSHDNCDASRDYCDTSRDNCDTSRDDLHTLRDSWVTSRDNPVRVMWVIFRTRDVTHFLHNVVITNFETNGLPYMSACAPPFDITISSLAWKSVGACCKHWKMRAWIQNLWTNSLNVGDVNPLQNLNDFPYHAYLR